MQCKTLIAAAISTAFAASAFAADDKASSGSSAARENVGAEKMFQALDKDRDGYLTREEAQGTPHAKDFDTLDKNHDGKLSREEHAAAPEHQSGSTGATSSGDSQKKD